MCNHLKVYSGEFWPFDEDHTRAWICEICGECGWDKGKERSDIKKFASLYLNFVEPDNIFWRRVLEDEKI